MKLITNVLRRRRNGRGTSDPAAELSRIEPLSEYEAGLIPDADFVSASFDTKTVVCPSRMIVILSTPRSGSTYLCERLQGAGFCTAHEYFQQEQYLPLLADRWGCIENGRVSWSRYVLALERHRTSAQRVLGINVHGTHLHHFAEAMPYFTAPAIRYVWLKRRDKLRQAVSFAIARQTGQWSSNFQLRGEAKYDYGFLRRRLNMIHSQEDLIAAFLHARSLAYDTIYYEDFVSDPRTMLKAALGVDIGETTPDNRALRRQGGATNDAWVVRLARDMFLGPDA